MVRSYYGLCFSDVSELLGNLTLPTYFIISALLKQSCKFERRAKVLSTLSSAYRFHLLT